METQLIAFQNYHKFSNTKGLNYRETFAANETEPRYT